MKNRFFDKNLYAEGLRQTRTIGIVNGVILFIGIFFSLLFNIFRYLEYFMSGRVNDFELDVGGILANPLVFVTISIFSVVLMFSLFSFLNQRNRCDFYHSIPQKRETLATSFFLAVLTWQIAGIIVSSALSITAYTIFPTCTVNYGEIMCFTLNMCAATILVDSAIFFALSFTGRIFSNIFMTLIIIFFPRLMITSINGMIALLAKLLPTDKISFLDYNLVAGMFLSPLKMFGYGGIFDLKCGLYTLILGIIYFFIGLAFFKDRPSEMAGKSTKSRLGQAVLRLCFGQIFCLLPTFLLCLFISNFDLDEMLYEIYAVILLYVFAIVAYLLFELISTKKARNMLKALPGLGILAAVNAAIIGIVFLVTVSVNIYSPRADDIKYVKITKLNAYYYSIFDSGYSDNIDYFSPQASKVKLSDTTTRVIISDAIERNKNPDKYNYKDYEYTPTKTIEVKINSGFVSKDRKIKISTNDFNYIVSQIIKENPTLFTNLPKVSAYRLDIDDDMTYTDKQKKELYDTLCEEVKSVNPQKWYDVLIKRDYYYIDYLDEDSSDVDETEIKHYTDICVYANQSTYLEPLYVPITDLTPRTLSLYKQYRAENNLKNK
jgi:hypothetical protein